MQPRHETDTDRAAVVLVDTHCHLDARQLAGEATAAVLERASDAGVVCVVTIGTDLASSRRAVALAAAHGCVHAAVGVDPNDLDGFGDATLHTLADLAASPRVVAIGEIGLDFHYDHSPRDTQREAFRRQIRLAREVGLPIVVHTREADGETADILEEEGAAEAGGVVHCFTGGLDLAHRALGLGFLISFSGIVAFPRAYVIQQVAREVPPDRLLVETDAPFLAPPPHRGKRNEPAFVVDVARKVAALRGTTAEAVGSLAHRNYARLFRRPE
jgi:TatD DNase family protein